ncbi:hypothetical protein FZEAL_394 [Fusarium zealandicum]|uniref:5-methylcytosine G/T mismatch-specific DNA glycosylase n=1 Tax=Fusarium zealandicum TaxID=1053134 RepID=A0A8H4UVG6_9HYPO|nr:hypothetical protein FZEAL_394 [Fusarium zealandicum]
MSSKDHDAEVPVDEPPREKTRRSKSERKERRDRDRDRDPDREKDPERDRDRERRRHRSTRSSKSKLSEGSDTVSHTSSRRHRHRRERDHDDHHRRRERAASTSDLLGSDLARTSTAATSILSDRRSMPYPSFSKAHSKEAIVSRDSLAIPHHAGPPTPEPTDAAAATEEPKSPRSDVSSEKPDRPPSPPETDPDADKKPDEAVKEEIPEEEGAKGETPTEETPEEEARKVETPTIHTPTEEIPADEGGLDRPKSSTPNISRSASRNEGRSRVSRRSASSSQATYVKTPAMRSQDKLRSESRASSSSRFSTKRTSSTRSPRIHEADEAESSPSSAQDSSPKTPTQTPFPNVYPETKPETPSAVDVADDDSNLHSKTATPASGFAHAPPPPPPPPPPALDLQDVPRVDYLLQNGGLAYPAPKSFLSVLPRQNGTRPSNPPLSGVDTMFAPFFNLLDQYNTVLNKQGSIAVATGHRSVARRLLDRLENVFSRDLPTHGCTCIMCDNSHEIHQGLNWGDVLEWVSGRIELPQWPPFDLAEIGAKAAEVSADVPPRPASPVKLDPDIAEEFREHYLRQSKKVRSAVDRWLSNTGETPVPPPQEVDDETLCFAILTNLDAEDRPYFNALVSGSRELRSSNRAPTPVHRNRIEFLIKTGLALQRLYRLSQAPRDAEAATYLIRNPHTHDLLVALSNINNSEWEILISGRFDGFLWSGADDEMAHAESRGATPASGYYNTRTMSPGPRASSGYGSRTTTPFSVYSRGTTPASFVSLASSGIPGNRQAVSNDEEMEMAVIAEIEREIYKGMESLEDAFEKLHLRAETVRTALRQRGAGLMQNLQNRRRIDILSGPSSGNSQASGYERPAWAGGGGSDPGSDDDWDCGDTDIMPDDSASNISSSRHRRPKRRTERRTPAPIDEEDED